MVQGRGSECIHDCRNPAWGGEGMCNNTSAEAPTCLCEEGFASRDAMGNASCVPRRVLVAGYVVLAVASFLATAVLVWEANKFRHLPAVLGASRRRTLIRLRALVSSSVYTIGFGCIGVVLATFQGEAGFSDDGFLQAEYGVLIPSLIFAVAMLAEFWVDVLPSQLLPAGSMAEKLKNISERHNVIIVWGGLNAGVISILGILTLVFPVWAKIVADVAALVGGLSACLAVLFVAIRMTLVINRSMKKASETSKAFYSKAKKNIRLQTLSLCTILGAEMIMGIVKGVTNVGQNVAVAVWYMQILAAQAGAVLFALATNFQGPQPSRNFKARSRTSLATGTIFPQHGLPGAGQRRAFISGGAARFANMPLKHLAQVRRNDTESDEESDLSSTTTETSVPQPLKISGRLLSKLPETVQSSASFEVEPASGRRKSSWRSSARGSHSPDTSAERGGGGAHPGGMTSALNHAALPGIGEEKKATVVVDEHLAPNSAPRSELGAPTCLPQQDLPPIAVRKAAGQTNGITSMVGERSPNRAGGHDSGGLIRLRSDSTKSLMASEQQKEVSDQVVQLTPRESCPTESSRVSSVSSMLKTMGGGDDIPVTGKVVPIEQ